MPPGGSPRGRGNFQAFMAGGRQGYDGGRGGRLLQVSSQNAPVTDAAFSIMPGYGEGMASVLRQLGSCQSD